MVDFKEVKQLALNAYMDTWRKFDLRWCPPPTQIKDRKWSQILRETWPEYTTVDVKRKDTNIQYSDMKKWCDEKPSSYWVNGGGDRWYFERRDIAALFKLTFGGTQND